MGTSSGLNFSHRHKTLSLRSLFIFPHCVPQKFSFQPSLFQL